MQTDRWTITAVNRTTPEELVAVLDQKDEEIQNLINALTRTHVETINNDKKCGTVVIATTAFIVGTLFGIVVGEILKTLG